MKKKDKGIRVNFHNEASGKNQIGKLFTKDGKQIVKYIKGEIPADKVEFKKV